MYFLTYKFLILGVNLSF
ncbi:hypothetical protein TFKS16_1996 [Tannerella forsythia KS16]|nr:hypothetical protein TF3313_2040 [Tannerella forsythia 3313]BAR52211.1 hypothetical protein TFKS16_1996 [Tannerella forsythia KS16]